MSKRANPAIIGAFVLGGCILGIGAIFLIGGDELYKEKEDFIMYFEGSVNGLNVGSPINLRGVQVGKVKNISLINDAAKGEIRIPVMAEFYPENVISIGQEFDSRRKNVKKMVEQLGLRAQLQTQSMLTGQLFVQLDYHPHSPYKYYGDGSMIEVPIIPSTLELFEKKLQEFDFSSITNDITILTTAITEMVKNPKLNQSIDNLAETLIATNQTMLSATKLINDVDSQINPLSKKTHRLLDELQFTLSHINSAAVNIEELTNDESPTFYKMHAAMDELTRAAKSIRELTDTLDQQPEALFQGKKTVN